MFGDKLFGRHTGIPTPTDIPVDTTCLTLQIPNDPGWWAAITGHLTALMEESAWQQFDGGLSVEDAAEIASTIVTDALERAASENGCVMDCSDILACLLPYSGLPAMALTRVSGGKPQFSLDGGTTWTDMTDPGTNNVPQVPDRTVTAGADDDAKMCLASTRAVLAIAEFYKQTAGAVAADLLNTSHEIFNFLQAFTNAAFEFIYSPYDGLLDSVIFDPLELPTDYSAGELDQTAKDALLCLLLGNASVTAGIVSFDFQAVYDNLIATLGTNPGTAVTLLCGYMGEVGLNRMGDVASTDTADCAACGTWCYYVNFGAGMDGWTLQGGTWVEDQGWRGAYYGDANRLDLWGEFVFADTYVETLEFHYTKSGGAGANNVGTVRWYKDGALVSSDTSNPTGYGIDRTVTINANIDKVYIDFNVGTATGQTLVVEEFRIRGPGANPNWTDNCP